MRGCFTSWASEEQHFDNLLFWEFGSGRWAEEAVNDEQKKRPDFDRQQALEERLLRFASSVMDFAGAFAQVPETRPMVSQLVRSASSIGANYAEANASESKADFIHKCSISRKEASETRYWLKLAIFRGLGDKTSADKLLDESEQLVRLFASIVGASRRTGS